MWKQFLLQGSISVNTNVMKSLKNIQTIIALQKYRIMWYCNRRHMIRIFFIDIKALLLKHPNNFEENSSDTFYVCELFTSTNLLHCINELTGRIANDINEWKYSGEQHSFTMWNKMTEIQQMIQDASTLAIFYRIVILHSFC